MKTITIITCVILGLATFSAQAADTAPAKSLDEISKVLQSKLHKAVESGKPDDAAKWAAALQSTEAAGLIRSNRTVTDITVKVVEEFRPQLEAVPALIRRLFVKSITTNLSSTKMQQSFSEFFNARSSVESIPLVHAMVRDSEIEKQVNELRWSGEFKTPLLKEFFPEQKLANEFDIEKAADRKAFDEFVLRKANERVNQIYEFVSDAK